jgi:hypothetical protein
MFRTPHLRLSIISCSPHGDVMAQVLKQECKQSTVLSFVGRLGSAQDLNLYYDKFIVPLPSRTPNLAAASR